MTIMSGVTSGELTTLSSDTSGEMTVRSGAVCPGTVIVTCGRSEHFMTVDPTTARNLEIAAPLGTRGEAVKEASGGGGGAVKAGAGAARAGKGAGRAWQILPATS